MKLSRIYSNDKRFRPIKFNEGFNVIVGKIVDRSNLDTNSHNLGKSTLVELIDFMLLKGINKKHFFKEKSQFNESIFFLEIKVSESKYITIKRSIEFSSKVSFKFHDKPYQDFTYDTWWDYVDLPMTSNDIHRNPVWILNNYIKFNSVLPYSYRNYISYFLRSQYDYDEVFKLSKYKGSDALWKPMLAYLLGYNGEILKRKYDVEQQIYQEEKLLVEMEKELKVSINDLNRIHSLLDIAEKKRDFVRDKIDSFDFYFRERELNKALIEDIESEISRLNTLEYKLQYEIKEITNALESQNNFDLKKINKLFQQVGIYFPEQLSKSYKELIDFNKKITDERNKYLYENLKENKSILKETLEKLDALNVQRNDVLSVLKEKDSFAKFKKFQLELVEIENEINNLLNKLDNYEALQTISMRINSLNEDLISIVSTLKAHLEEGNNLFRDIQATFTSLAERILNETAVLYHRINNNSNVDFIADITSSDKGTLTSKANGYSYRKMLCVCFDLAILINYSGTNFFKFVYHDGSLEAMGDTKIITYFNTVKDICKKYDIQYILTTLDDHLPTDASGRRYALSEEEIVITLDNRSDDSGRLFGFSF